MYQSALKQPAVNALTKDSARKTLQMPPLFAAAVLQCRFWIRILCRKRLRTQPASRREGTQLSRKVNEMPPSFLKLNSPFRTPFRTFFSLPHMMFILCFWLFLRFWTQNAPNPTRFCTFAPFSGLERWHEAENSPFSTQKEKYISKPDLNIFCLFFARCTFSNMCPRRCSTGVKSWKQAQSLLTSRSYICYNMRDIVHKEQL